MSDAEDKMMEETPVEVEQSTDTTVGPGRKGIVGSETKTI